MFPPPAPPHPSPPHPQPHPLPPPHSLREVGGVFSRGEINSYPELELIFPVSSLRPNPAHHLFNTQESGMRRKCDFTHSIK